MYYRVNQAPLPASCAECAYLKDCGGLDGEAFHVGCFQRCERRCRNKICDCVCPGALVGFEEAWGEVGGICTPPTSCHQLPSTKLMPYYIPQVKHGSRRHENFQSEWVAVPLLSILSFSKYGCRIRFESKAELCESLKISRQSKIVLTCVSQDPIIEKFWQNHRYYSLLSRIYNLEFHAVTVPNFSLMLDTPRTNSLYNISRIYRMIERMSEAGIVTVPHLNASTQADWKKWENVLSMHRETQVVAMEFETGLGSSRERGKHYLRCIDNLQQILGRRLHPIAVGAGSWLGEFAAIFDSFTVIDSTPFMKTVHFQVPYKNERQTTLHWRTERQHSETLLDGLLERNVETYRQFYGSSGIGV